MSNRYDQSSDGRGYINREIEEPAIFTEIADGKSELKSENRIEKRGKYFIDISEFGECLCDSKGRYLSLFCSKIEVLKDYVIGHRNNFAVMLDPETGRFRSRQYKRIFLLGDYLIATTPSDYQLVLNADGKRISDGYSVSADGVTLAGGIQTMHKP
jgi:hypothetical protein